MTRCQGSRRVAERPDTVIPAGHGRGDSPGARALLEMP